MNLIRWLDKRKHWWKVFGLIFAVSVTVVSYIGYKTYEYAPPIADFRDPQGKIVCPAESITRGQQVYFRKGLMDYGSYLGDGGLRGPDFTGEALHLTAKWLYEHYDRQWRDEMPDDDVRSAFVSSLVQRELKKNTYDAATNAIALTAGQAVAFERRAGPATP